MSETVSLVVTLVAIAIVYEFLKPNNTQSEENPNESNDTDE